MRVVIMLPLLLSVLFGVFQFPEGASAWSGAVDTSWYRASAAQKEYTITRPEQLAGLAKLVNGGNSFKGKTIRLAKNIDLANRRWTSIGGGKQELWEDFRHPFSGTFDGGGRVITGLRIDFPFGCQGLFGYSNGRIVNLAVNARIVVDGSDHPSTRAWVGAIIGVNEGIVEKCSANSSIISRGKVIAAGGIAGENSGRVTDCTFTGSVEGDGAVTLRADEDESSPPEGTSIYESALGGVVGLNAGVVERCVFVGSVAAAIAEYYYGGTTVGGVVGLNDTKASVVGCSSRGEFKGTGKDTNDIGGVAGRNYGLIVRCNSTGKIHAEKAGAVGGIAGATYPASRIEDSTSNSVIIFRNPPLWYGGLVGFHRGSVVNSTWMQSPNVDLRPTGGGGK